MAKPVQWNDVLKLQLDTLLREGLSNRACAKALGVHQSTVGRHRAKLGYAPAPKAAYAQRLTALVRAGATTAQCAAALGVTEGYIRSLRRKLGIAAPQRPVHRPVPSAGRAKSKTYKPSRLLMHERNFRGPFSGGY